jgi:hypothetical protein
MEKDLEAVVSEQWPVFTERGREAIDTNLIVRQKEK